MGQIVIKGYDKRADLTKGKTILSYLQGLGIYIIAACGGQGECKTCLVKVEGAESLTPMTKPELEFITEPGYRLACQARIARDDMDIYIEIPRRRYQILERGVKKEVPLDPFIKVSNGGYRRVYWDGRELGRYEGEVFGIALDIGTTTLAMYWVDLEKGDERHISSMENPQIRYGNDVITRVNYAIEKDQRELERAIREGVNDMIQGGPIDPSHIYEMVVVGNTVMRDLFIGHPVEPLGGAPFEPVSMEAVNRSAEDLGLRINPKANVYAFPLIGGFIGGDALGVILATGIYKKREVTMAIDIGTNTEIVIGNEEELLATSCASGPAFEGSGIKWGVGGVGGAIKEIEIDEDLRVKYKTIGDLPPIGICGSGLIDALAQMLDRGIIDWRGRFIGDRRKFIIVKRKNPIAIDGEDIDKLKLAKSAISLGAKLLIERYGVKPSDVERLYLAGGFGNYINVENAYKIGLLPRLPLEKIERVGNAAIEGARQALISREKRREVEAIPKKIKHLRLEQEIDFTYKFMEELYFKRYRPS